MRFSPWLTLVLVSSLTGCGGSGPSSPAGPVSPALQATSADAPQTLPAATGGGGGGAIIETPAPVSPSAAPAAPDGEAASPNPSATPTVTSGGSSGGSSGGGRRPRPASPTPTPSATPDAAGNRAPVIGAFSANKLKSPDRLSVAVSDPDGDALTVTWTHADGTAIGVGPSVAYAQASEDTSPDETVNVTVSDGRGGETRASYAVDNYIGSEEPVTATSAFEWAPARTALAQLSGDVVVQTSGDFSVYNAVIAEYTTTAGRKLALLTPGETRLPGVTGSVYMYLLGPTGADSPKPTIAVTLSSGAQRVQRTITQANVVGDHHVGQAVSSGPGDSGYFVGENNAKNGAQPYRDLLYVESWGNLHDLPDYPINGEIAYKLLTTGDEFYGLDGRVCSGECDRRVLLTDSVGGAADNSGAWTLYHMIFD